MATTTSGVSFRFPPSNNCSRSTLFTQCQFSLSLSVNPRTLNTLKPLRVLKRDGAFLTRKLEKSSVRKPRLLRIRCESSRDGKITQQEFTDMAWQAIVSSPEVARENKHQIVETEHLMKALLEQKNGLARRIFSKTGVDNTLLLEATDKFIQRQPKVTSNIPGFSSPSVVTFSICLPE
ncbi:chaperone protein ClpB3, chloroplastic-like [Macadamia integrifolia]|uniref:chaperone protein ClpB3, chloroplastic-like n=1 Tax=Macadamia integrifolia TaxID=60698 RepID=UPI001C4E9D29|nr:chaperone protein ClpB3, chloroplastic-like [Macadamia integrifolia]